MELLYWLIHASSPLLLLLLLVLNDGNELARGMQLIN